MQDSYQKFARDVAAIGIANALGALGGIILLPLITKTLGAHDYGLWAQVTVTITFAMCFVGLGLPFALNRFLAAAKNKEEIQDGFYSVLSIVSISTLIVSLLLILLAEPLANAFFSGSLLVVRITGCIIFAYSLSLVCLNLFRSARQMKTYAIFTLADTYGQIGLIAYMVLNGHGLVGVVISVLAVKLAILLVAFLMVRAKIGFKIPRFSRMKEYLSFALPTIPTTMSDWMVSSSDRYVITYFLGAVLVGIYSAAYSIGAIPLMLASILGLVMPPTLSKLYDEERMDEVKTHLTYSFKYVLIIVIPFVCGAAILSRQVLALFSTGLIATQGYPIVPIVALAASLACVSIPFDMILVLVKKTKITGMACAIAAITNLGLNLLIVPLWGILAAAITTLVAYTVMVSIVIYFALKEFKFHIDWNPAAKSVIAAVIMSVVIWFMSPQNSWNTVVTVLVGAVVYGAGLFALKTFSRQEISFYKGVFGKSVSMRNK